MARRLMPTGSTRSANLSAARAHITAWSSASVNLVVVEGDEDRTRPIHRSDSELSGRTPPGISRMVTWRVESGCFASYRGAHCVSSWSRRSVRQRGVPRGTRDPASRARSGVAGLGQTICQTIIWLDMAITISTVTNTIDTLQHLNFGINISDKELHTLDEHA